MLRFRVDKITRQDLHVEPVSDAARVKWNTVAAITEALAAAFQNFSKIGVQSKSGFPASRESVRGLIFNSSLILLIIAGGNLKTDHQPPADDAGRFHTTRWTEVLLSAQSHIPGSHAALAELCKTYWYPIYAFVRRRGHDPDNAQDMTQGFFLHLLEHKALARVDPLKGKFRSFLLASLENNLSDEADRARRLKRGGNIVIEPLDTKSAEYRYQKEPLVEVLTADKIFDARWAITLLDEVMTRLGKEYVAQGKTPIFETLKPFLDPFDNKVSLSYEQVANALRVSVGSVKTLIHRLRRRYTCLLREEVSRTVSNPRDIDEEIHALCEAVIALKDVWVHE